MKIIDGHIHFSNIKSFHEVSTKSKVDYSLEGFKKEYQDVIAIGMGLTEKQDLFPSANASNPMTLDLDQNPDNLYQCLGFNPLKPYDLKDFEKRLTKNTVGLKIYAGYYHYMVDDPIYYPIYNFAKKHNLPVVIHSGDTFSEKGRLKYSQPLHVDEVAYLYPEVLFIIAHMGDPWIMDAAEVASKNKNVYVDLSGLIVGDEKDVTRFEDRLFIDHIKRGLIYLDNYDKVLFGSDWPLVPFMPYLNFIKKLIPEKHHEKVFYLNAKKVFNL